MHRYALEHRVSHADVDLLGEVKVAALLGLLEQAAVEASWECGFDPGWYTAQRRVWIIRRTRLERTLPLGGGDRVRIATHVLDWRRARSLRAYAVERLGADGTAVAAAYATTDWVYCDMTTGRPASVPEEMRRAFSGEADVTLPRARAIAESGAGEPVVLPLVVRPSLLDHVTHVNNAAYAAMLEDGAFELFAAHGWPVARMLDCGGALRMTRIDLEYLDDAVAGDELLVRGWIVSGDDDGVRVDDGGTTTPTTLAIDDATGAPRGLRLLQTIARSDGSRILRSTSDWLWRRRPAVLGGVPEA
ncbi:MAG: thioesterase [Candidatus Binatia bacterium]